MASNLAKQLQQLQTEQNRGKARASLLFHGREAADYDHATIFGIATNGFAELLQLAPAAFQPFADNIFSEAWIDLDRELKPADVNAEITALIGGFCRALCPYLPLRSAHKCLEWLIRRFKAHVYNVDALMELALPHSDTAIFGRLIQLLELNAASKVLGPGSSTVPLWHFLAPNQKSGAPLPRDVLARQCLKDAAVLRFVCDTASNAAAAAAKGGCKAGPALTWYALTVTDAITRATAITDAHMTLLLPYLLRGLSDAEVTDHQAASYVIGAALLSQSRAAVTQKVFASIVATTALHCDRDQPSHVVAFLSAVFAGQAAHQGITAAGHGHAGDNSQQAQWLYNFSIPSKAVKSLLRCNAIATTIAEVAASRDVSVFLRCLLTSSVGYVLARPGEASEVKSIIAHVPAHAIEPIVPLLARHILSRYVAIKRGNVSASAAAAEADGTAELNGGAAAAAGIEHAIADPGSSIDALASILRQMGQMYGQAVDDGIRNVSSSSTGVSRARGRSGSIGDAAVAALDADHASAVAWSSGVLAGTDVVQLQIGGSNGSSRSRSNSISGGVGNRAASPPPHAASSGDSEQLASPSGQVSLRLALSHGSALVREAALGRVRSEAAALLAASGHGDGDDVMEGSGAASSVSSDLQSTRLRMISHALERGMTDDDAAVVLAALAVHSDLLPAGLVAVPSSSTEVTTTGDASPSSSGASACVLLDSLLSLVRKWTPAASDRVEKLIPGFQQNQPNQQGASAGAAAPTTSGDAATASSSSASSAAAGASQVAPEVRARIRSCLDSRSVVIQALRLASGPVLQLASAAGDNQCLADNVAVAILSLLPIGNEQVGSQVSRSIHVQGLGEVAVLDVRASAVEVAVSSSHALFAHFKGTGTATASNNATQKLATALLASLAAQSSSSLLSVLQAQAASSSSVSQRAKWQSIAVIDTAVALASAAKAGGPNPLPAAVPASTPAKGKNSSSGSASNGGARGRKGSIDADAAPAPSWPTILQGMLPVAARIIRDEWRSACTSYGAITTVKRDKEQRSQRHNHNKERSGSTAAAAAAASDAPAAAASARGHAVTPLPALGSLTAADHATVVSNTARGVWADIDTDADTSDDLSTAAHALRAASTSLGATGSATSTGAAAVSAAHADYDAAKVVLMRNGNRLKSRLNMLAGSLQRVSAACTSLIGSAKVDILASAFCPSEASSSEASSSSAAATLLGRTVLLLLSTSDDACAWESIAALLPPLLAAAHAQPASASSSGSLAASPVPFLMSVAAASVTLSNSNVNVSLVTPLAAARAIELCRCFIAGMQAPMASQACAELVQLLFPPLLLCAADARTGPAHASLRGQAVALLSEVASMASAAGVSAASESALLALYATIPAASPLAPLVKTVCSGTARLLEAAAVLSSSADVAIADGAIARKLLRDHMLSSPEAQVVAHSLAVHACVSLQACAASAAAPSMLSLALQGSASFLPLWPVLHAILGQAVAASSSPTSSQSIAAVYDAMTDAADIALEAVARLPSELTVIGKEGGAPSSSSAVSVVVSEVVKSLCKVFTMSAALLVLRAGKPLVSSAGASEAADASGTSATGAALVVKAIACVTPALWKLACAAASGSGPATTPAPAADSLFESLLALVHRGSPEVASAARHAIGRLRLPAAIIVRYMRAHNLSCEHLAPAASSASAASDAAALKSVTGDASVPSFRHAAAVAAALPATTSSIATAMAWVARATVLAEVLVAAGGSRAGGKSQQSQNQQGASSSSSSSSITDQASLLDPIFSVIEVLVALRAMASRILAGEASVAVPVAGASSQKVAATSSASGNTNGSGKASRWEEEDVDSSLEYATQLMLTAAHHATQAIAPATTSASTAAPIASPHVAALDPTLPIHCVHATKSTQTRGAALLLLSSMAAVVPAAVLTRLMPVLMTVGHDALARDDSFSFQTMQRLIEAVVPPLRQHGASVGVPLHSLLKVFAVCVHRVPTHRQKHLYSTLIQVATGDGNGVDKSRLVPSMTALLMAQHVIGKSVTGGANVDDNTSALASSLPALSDITTRRGTDKGTATSASTSAAPGAGDDASSLGPIPDLCASLLARFAPAQQLRSLGVMMDVALRLMETPLHADASASAAAAAAPAVPAAASASANSGSSELDQLMPLLLSTGLPSSVSSIAAIQGDASAAASSSSSASADVALTPAQRCAVALAMLRFIGAHMSSRDFIVAALSTTPAGADGAPSTSSAGGDRMQKYSLLLSERVFDVLQMASTAAETAQEARKSALRKVREAAAEVAALSASAAAVTSSAAGSSSAEAKGKKQKDKPTSAAASELKAAKARASDAQRFSSSLAALSRFWSLVSDSSYVILDRLSALLPPSAFVAIVSTLLHHDDSSIRRRSLAFLSSYLSTSYGQPAGAAAEAEAELAAGAAAASGGAVTTADASSKEQLSKRQRSKAAAAEAAAAAAAAAKEASGPSAAEVLLFLQLLPDLLAIVTNSSGSTSSAPAAASADAVGDAAMGTASTSSAAAAVVVVESEANRVTALETIAMLASYFAKGHAAAFKPVIAAVAKMVNSSPEAPASSSSSPAGVLPLATRAAALLCLARLCAHVGPAAALAHLSVLVPRTLEAAEWSLAAHAPSSAPAAASGAASAGGDDDEEAATQRVESIANLRTSSLSSLRLLVAALPSFLSPYLPRILKALLHQSAIGPLPSQPSFVRFDRRVTIGDDGEPRLVLPALDGRQVRAAAAGAGTTADTSNGEGPLLDLPQASSSSAAAAVAVAPGVASLCASILGLLPSKVESRVLLPALLSSYSQLATAPASTDASGGGAVHHALALLLRAITITVTTHMSKGEVREQLPRLFKFVMSAGDYRWRGCAQASEALAVLASANAAAAAGAASSPTSPSASAIASASARLSSHAIGASVVETEVITLLSTIVVRLNDKQLRPVLLRLQQWAGTEPGDIQTELELAGDGVAAGGASTAANAPSYWAYASLCRRIFLYRSLDALTTVAKSLFVSYLGYCLPDACKELQTMAAAASASAAAVGGGGNGSSGKKARRDGSDDDDSDDDQDAAAEDGMTIDTRHSRARGDMPLPKAASAKGSKSGKAAATAKSKHSDSDADAGKGRRKVHFAGGDDSDDDDEEAENSDAMDEDDEDAPSDESDGDSADDDDDGDAAGKTATAAASASITGTGSTLPYSLLHVLDGLWSRPVLHAGAAGAGASDGIGILGSPSVPAGTPSSAIPSSPHALRCVILGLLRRAFTHDTALPADQSLMGKSNAEGRARLEMVMRPLLAQIELPLALTFVQPTAARIAAAAAAAKVGTKRGREQEPSSRGAAPPAVTTTFLHGDASSASSSSWFSSVACGGIPCGHAGYTGFSSTYLQPLVAALTSALRADTAWKPLTTALLLLTRSDKPRVRLTSLLCVSEVFARGGEDALVLLPEVLPFLSELLQDSDHQGVAAEASSLLARLEQASGEDLQSYLQ